MGSDRLEVRGKEDLLIRRGNTVQADILLLNALRGERAGRRERLRAPTIGGSHFGEVTLKVESAIRDDLLRKSTKIEHQIPLRGIGTNGERIQYPELNGGDALLLQVPYLQR